MTLTCAIVVLLLAFTAVPVELRSFDVSRLALTTGPEDIAANVLGYIPIGFLFARLGTLGAFLVGTSISVFAELMQMSMMHRYPSLTDVVTNASGVLLGALAGRLYGRTLTVPLSPRTGYVAATALMTLMTLMTADNWSALTAQEHALSVNPRGVLRPGSLEASWTFDTLDRTLVPDLSPNRADGRLLGRHQFSAGVRGRALDLDGKTDLVDFGSPIALRLMGSLTVTAWINSASFPRDDAAIVSAQAASFQLDTTIDRGARTIGFKLVDRCGNLFARYGRTPLALGTWYHVAGVYDAAARTLHVYLNGKPDDGDLVGHVTGVQQASPDRIVVGQRADRHGYAFAGLIDDVRIYSRPLTPAEVESDMQGVTMAEAPPDRASTTDIDVIRQMSDGRGCHQPTRPQDAYAPGWIVAVGVLTAVISTCFSHSNRVLPVVASLIAGCALLPAAMVVLPAYALWMVPLLSLAGGVSVAVSINRASSES